MRIIVDAMGGDLGVPAMVDGALAAQKKWGFELILVGDQKEIEDQLKSVPRDKQPMVVSTTEVVSNEDRPALVVRRKKDASMVRAMEMLAAGEADGMLSTGNTGALLAGGMLILKRLPGLKRAALASVYPTTKSMALLVDAGANADLQAETLAQFATMASIYYQNAFHQANPRIGLVNVGVEKGKGNHLAQETYELLEKSQLNFIGNVEARDIPFGICDVIVCDGFTGNVILKLTEGMAYAAGERLKEVFYSNFKTKMGGLLVKSKLKEMKAQLDYRQYGAVPLLGLEKPLFKAHGSSDALAIENGLGRLVEFVQYGVITQMKQGLEGETREGE